MGPLDRSGQCCGRAAQGRAGEVENVRSELLDRQKEVLYTEKFLRMDYADCDRQETRDLFSQIRQNADWSGWGFAHLKLYYTQAVQGITGILGAAALTVSLFTRQVPISAGKLTALNHPLFLVGILLLIAAVTCLGPALVGRAYSAWNTLAEQVCFGNRVFSHFVFMQPGDKEKTWIAECTARANWRSIMSAQ